MLAEDWLIFCFSGDNNETVTSNSFKKTVFSGWQGDALSVGCSQILDKPEA